MFNTVISSSLVCVCRVCKPGPREEATPPRPRNGDCSAHGTRVQEGPHFPGERAPQAGLSPEAPFSGGLVHLITSISEQRQTGDRSKAIENRRIVRKTDSGENSLQCASAAPQAGLSPEAPFSGGLVHLISSISEQGQTGYRSDAIENRRIDGKTDSRENRSVSAAGRT